MPTSSKPLVTIFLSCHNQAQYLQQALDSIEEQTFRDFELIMFDDRSTDVTEGLMHNFCIKHPYARYWKLLETRNVGEVINKSLEYANGRYWVWCPADDLLAPTLLSDKVAYAKRYPATIIYNDFYRIDEAGHIIGYTDIPIMEPKQFAKIVWVKSPIGFTGIWIPTKFLRALPFPTHLQYSEDFYWMIKATIHGYHFRGLKKGLHYKREHNDSNTRRNLQRILAQVPKIRQELQIYKETR